MEGEGTRMEVVGMVLWLRWTGLGGRVGSEGDAKMLCVLNFYPYIIVFFLKKNQRRLSCMSL